MEQLLAAFVPPLVLTGLVAWRYPAGSDERSAAKWFAVLALVWFAPCWVQGRTPVALDFLVDMSPWSATRSAGYLISNPLLNDVPLQMLPWREAVRGHLLAGSAPFLGRFAAGGVPLWENLQTAILFPVNVVSWPLSTFAWPLFSGISKVLIALWGTWLFLRRLGTSGFAAILGSIAYAFGAFTITYLLFPHSNVTAVLPWLLFAMTRAIESRNWRWTAAAAALLFVLIAGGHPESVLHSAFLAVPWAIRCVLILPRTERSAAVGRIAAFGVTGLLLSAPLLVPFAAYLPHTHRVHEIETVPGLLSTPPFELETFVTLLVPNYFGNPRVHNYRHPYNFNEMCGHFAGLVTLVLAIAAAIAEPRRHRFWIITAAVSLFLAIEPMWLYESMKGIPIIGVTAHSRIRFLVALAQAVLAAHAFDAITRGEHTVVVRRVALTIFGAIAAICLLSFPLFMQYGIRRLIFFTEIAALAGVLLVILGTRAANPLLIRAVPVMLFLDLFSVVGLYNPAVSREWYYPANEAIQHLRDGATTGGRFLGLGRAAFPNVGVFYGLEDVREHDPVAYRPYVALLEKAGMDPRDYFARFNAEPSKHLLDFLGVEQVIANRSNAVTRRPSALPRIFVPSAVQPSHAPGDAFLAQHDARSVFAETAAPVARANVSFSYGRNGAVVDVDATGETFLATSEASLPGWRLRRNDADWQWERINGAFVGWRVPAGRSRFELSYVPQHLTASLAAAAAGALALLAMMYRRREAKAEVAPTSL